MSDNSRYAHIEGRRDIVLMLMQRVFLEKLMLLSLILMEP